MLQIGGHISVGGLPISSAIEIAKAAGMTAIQIFPGSPQRYIIKQVSDEEADRCRKLTAELPLFIHMAYTANPAVANPNLRQAIIDYYLKCSHLAKRLGARGVITHSGSYGEGGSRKAGIARVRSVLADLHPLIDTKFILENVAGFGTSLGRQPEDMMEMVEGFEKMGIVWDTLHGFSQGVDMSNLDKVQNCLSILKPKLSCLHFNGAPDNVTLGCHRDRHQLMSLCPRLSKLELLKAWFSAGVPFIIENPDGTNVQDDMKFLSKAYASSLTEGPSL